MSFGVSPSDVIKLVEFSTRIYVAFRDANNNSEAQVKAFVKEFSDFHQCLLQLEELMKEYGKRLPLPIAGFKDTLVRCQTTLLPYLTHLVDNRSMTWKKAYYTIQYIGKEKDLESLRKQILGHYQALQVHLQFVNIRLQLEATKQTQRLLAPPPFRSISVDGHTYTTNSLASSCRPRPNALPAPSDESQDYREWLLYDQWLRIQNERLSVEEDAPVRPVSLGGTPVVAPIRDDQTAAALYRLQKEVEDIMLVKENRAKRLAAEGRTHLSPSDAIRREIQAMPPMPPQRAFSLETYNSDLSETESNPSRPMATISPTSISSPNQSPVQPSRLSHNEFQFQPVQWGQHLSPTIERSDSVSTYSTTRTSFSTSPGTFNDGHGLGIETNQTTPAAPSLYRVPSLKSLASLALGRNVLAWETISKYVQVQRTVAQRIQTCECDIQWCYREDTGLSFRTIARPDKKRVWTTQHFPPSGSSIPLTTTDPDGEVSLDFPRLSCGKLDKNCTDIKYTFRTLEASKPFQTMLYSNNGQDRVTLLFDRRVKELGSDKNATECRGRNIRLWKKIETQDDPDGHDQVDVNVLYLVFYTSALKERDAHWVEEPHHVFQWLGDSEYKKSSDKLRLVFSKDPTQWTTEKLFRIRKDSKDSSHVADLDQSTSFQDSQTSLQRSNTVTSIASSIKSARSDAPGRRRGNRAGNLNRFGYGHLDIKFQCKEDRKEFLKIWKKYVRPLDHVDRR